MNSVSYKQTLWLTSRGGRGVNEVKDDGDGKLYVYMWSSAIHDWAKVYLPPNYAIHLELGYDGHVHTENTYPTEWNRHLKKQVIDIP